MANPAQRLPRRVEPAPGQESVWSYPRPPRLEPTTRRVRVEHAGELVVDSRRAVRVLETSHPPVWYVPPEDVRGDLLERAGGSSYCEWKGRAVYYDLVLGDRRVERVAWSYPSPGPAFRPIQGWLAFFADRADACYVDAERVRPQPGGFYGGWITDDVVGPFKGEPGTWGW